MRQHHVALWVSDLDSAAAFWTRHFGARVGELYVSQRQSGFMSRFIDLGTGDLRIELMTRPGLRPASAEAMGWAHIAISLGSAEAADAASARFRAENRLMLGPRVTGDGFYEAMIRGPDDAVIEITI